jgi:hypothetical protein
MGECRKFGVEKLEENGCEVAENVRGSFVVSVYLVDEVKRTGTRRAP